MRPIDGRWSASAVARQIAVGLSGEEMLLLRCISAQPVIIRCMACPTAQTLFDNYARATMDLFEITDKLSSAVGQHEQFAETKKENEEVYQKCRDARLALEQHRALHGCG